MQNLKSHDSRAISSLRDHCFAVIGAVHRYALRSLIPLSGSSLTFAPEYDDISNSTEESAENDGRTRKKELVQPRGQERRAHEQKKLELATMGTAGYMPVDPNFWEIEIIMGWAKVAAVVLAEAKKICSQGISFS